MSNFTDFEDYGYQIIEKLGINTQAGRVTYKAINIDNQEIVVIKQFGFITNSDWDGYKAVEREINVLQGLKHPGIPCYLNSFDPGDGICLVQEYKDAQNLAISRKFNPEEIKKIAIQILEILVYLQTRIPPIIHRDIKPENILVDEELKVYLVDFGLARIGGGEITALSSIVAGTPGFIAPEQLLNRPLNTGSDLYGLGVTLICLLTGIKSRHIGELIDSSFHINFQPMVSHLTIEFIQWLEKMVQPNFKERYGDAFTALKALKPLDIIRVPVVELSQSMLEFRASKWGEKLTKTITVSNSIPNTLLEGKWEVAPHPNDLPASKNNHVWISFKPASFVSNKVECQITVDTSKLMANAVYERQLLLHTNSAPDISGLYIKIQTNSLPIKTRKISYFPLVGVFIAAGILTWVSQITVAIILFFTVFVALLCAVGGIITGGKNGAIEGAKFGVVTGAVAGVLTGVFAGANQYGVWVLFLTLILALVITKIGFNIIVKKGFNRSFAMLVLTLTAGLGITVGMGITLGFFHPLIILALIGVGWPLTRILIYPSFNQVLTERKYRQLLQGEDLIKP